MENQESFRDRLTTISKEGKRVWIYPKKPKGKFFNYRFLLGIFLLLFFFIAPLIKIKGEQFLLLNFIERKFVIFGVIFWPQDFQIFFLSMIGLIVFIVIFTVIYGRIFCGWICPQTIFMEILFRQIEYWIDGSHHQQRVLAQQNWSFNKIWKRSLKHSIFYIISFIISTTFLAYIIGSETLVQLSKSGLGNNVFGFIGLLIFSGIFYFIFAFFREQVCTIACPYGRLQGVLLDNNSIVVAYDYKRGEPREQLVKGEDRKSTTKGDCVDCNNCVLVCPTGIDIRNGTQLECINCTACIDACNEIMKKVKLPTGLIRYASEKEISEGKSKLFNIRVLAYTTVLIVLLALIGYMFTARTDIESTITRVSGTMFQEYGENKISNIYSLQVVNKTRKELKVNIELLEPAGLIKMIGDDVSVKHGEVGNANFIVILNQDDLISSKTPLKIGVYSENKMIEEIISTFVGPNKLDK